MKTEIQLQLRLRVLAPPAGVEMAVQRGKNELELPVQRSEDQLVFQFSVRVGKRPDGSPNFLGPFTQGPADGRFVYLNSGTLAGQSDSAWTRRAKVPLTGIGWELIQQARDQNIGLEAGIPGTADKGGPVHASLRAFEGWKVAQARAT